MDFTCFQPRVFRQEFYRINFVGSLRDDYANRDLDQSVGDILSVLGIVAQCYAACKYV